jgi:hypothetical protein
MLLTPLIQKFGNKPFLESKQQFTEDFIKNNFSSLLKSGLNMFAVAATCTTEKTPDEDYEGKWEDAFLFSGFENGKYSFLTPMIVETLKRHGFDIEVSHQKKLTELVSDRNVIITKFLWKGKTCIPEKDIKGDYVILGVTEPRLYLPDVVIKLLDLEYGYDKELDFKPY